MMKRTMVAVDEERETILYEIVGDGTRSPEENITSVHFQTVTVRSQGRGRYRSYLESKGYADGGIYEAKKMTQGL